MNSQIRTGTTSSQRRCLGMGEAFGMIARDQGGFASALVAGILAVVIGFVGMAVDLSHWYAERRLTQNIADAAAVAATYARLEIGEDLPAIRDVAVRAARMAGYEDVAGNELQVSLAAIPIGASASAPGVTVDVHRAVPLFFSRIFLAADHGSIAARAVGGLRGAATSSDTVCVLARHDSGTALTFTGSNEARIDCIVASNSPAGTACASGGQCEPALLLTGSADVFASRLQSVGKIEKQGNGGTVHAELRPFTSPPLADPYEGRALPVPAGCDVTGGLTIKKSTTRLNCAESEAPCVAPTTPGGSLTICGGLKIQGAVTLKPGRYFVKGGDFDANAQADIKGTGVSVVMAASRADAADLGTVKINGQARLELSAPTSGDYAGIVFYQDRDATQATPPAANKLNGGSELKLTGALYFPNGNLEYEGGADQVGCTQIIADTIKFTGNSSIVINDACAGTGVTTIAPSVQRDVVLVE
jgi:hypothetical protein